MQGKTLGKSRFIVCVLIALCILAACSDAGSDALLNKLHGRWRIDLTAFFENNPQNKEMSRREKEVAMSLLKASLGDLAFDFDVHKKQITMSMREEEGIESFTAKSATPDLIVLSTDRGEVKIAFLGDHRIRLTDETQKTLVLYRE